MDQEAFAKFDREYVQVMKALYSAYDMKELKAAEVMANTVFWTSILSHNLPEMLPIAAKLISITPNLCGPPERGH
jgi:hypothetical protein